jgi:hypothetical protein
MPMPRTPVTLPNPVSTYITDEDLERLKALHPDAKVSQMVRAAVRYYVETKKPN